jgi:hypothetical protein
VLYFCFRAGFIIGIFAVKPAVNKLLLLLSSSSSSFKETFFIKDKAVPLQAWTGPEGSRRSRLPDF